MYYYVTFNTNDSDSIKRYIFEIEERGRNGWAKLRMCRIQTSNPSHIEDYNPAIHDGGSHYMSLLYPARHFKHKYIREDGSQHIIDSYTLYGPFGNPGHKIDLEPSEVIEIEEEEMPIENNI